MLHMKRSIDSLTSLPFLQYYKHFYDCLLSLHFKYNDMDAAAKLLIDLHRQRKSGVFFNDGLHKQGMIQIGSGNLKTGYRIMFHPGKMDKGFVLDTESQFGLVVLTDGNLLHSERALAKLIVGCVKARNMHALSSVFITLHKEYPNRVCPLDVTNACIQMGWLHAAHDILDHLEAAGIPIGISSYIHLLRSYEKESKSEEFNRLLQQIQKMASSMDDINTNSSFTIKSIAKIVKNDTPFVKSSLFGTLVEEIRHYNPRDHLTLEFNNSIIFFCKAKMMEDALCTYKRMREKNIRPTCHTFCHILCGYSSMGMHREITILWGEVKRRVEYGDLDVDRDLLDSFVLNFLKGGYFSRVMEVIICMSNHNMYCDKWKYRHAFLKLHRNLYRNLSSLHDKTEAQNKRIEDVQAFRSWVGIK
jgi:pentatricopeptide repeat protein